VLSFRVEQIEDFLKSLEEARKLILEREKLLKDRVNFAVKIRDYTAEAIYVLTSEILELEKLFHNVHGNTNIKIRSPPMIISANELCALIEL
jgi:hypothetical protein